ncbi:MAG: GNAT family N-acetyltransferase [Candidatus Gastranaerophilales bacterium]|nr:GNAT family N-acetyltransferase [Candidatus Gastranaerophilales bacterium]
MNFINIKNDKEIEQLASLASEIWHEYWPDIISPAQIEYMIEKFQSYNAIKKQIEEERYIYNIFEDNGNIIGYFGVCPEDNYFFLSKLYIKKDFRYLGCGKQAFKKIQQIAQQYNKSSIQLTVNKYNTNTIKVYEKWGFKEINAIVSDIGGGFVMDDYIMEFKLS